MATLTQIRNNIYTALHEEADATYALASAQAEYDALLETFHADNPELVTRLEDARIRQVAAERALIEWRAKAEKQLEGEFIDDLPSGFEQVPQKAIVYDKQSLRKQALAHFHHLLVLDDEMVEKFFFGMAHDLEGQLCLPETIRSLASVKLMYAPDVTICNETIQLLKLDDTSDLSIFADALPNDSDYSPADELINKPDDMTREKVALIEGLAETKPTAVNT